MKSINEYLLRIKQSGIPRIKQDAASEAKKGRRAAVYAAKKPFPSVAENAITAGIIALLKSTGGNDASGYS